MKGDSALPDWAARASFNPRNYTTFCVKLMSTGQDETFSSIGNGVHTNSAGDRNVGLDG